MLLSYLAPLRLPEAGKGNSNIPIGPECEFTQYDKPISSSSCTNSVHQDTLRGVWSNPYISQLRSGFQTGLLKDYIPRMNSFVSYNILAETAFPSNCSLESNAYYIEHSYNRTLFVVKVCMPDALTSPWKDTGDRQDISERLYINVHSNDHTNTAFYENSVANGTYEVVVNMTLGYFEVRALQLDPFFTEQEWRFSFCSAMMIQTCSLSCKKHSSFEY